LAEGGIVIRGFRSQVVDSGVRSVYYVWRNKMPLKKEYIRDREHRIIGSVTSGFTGAYDAIVKDEHERIVGRTSERFHTTRDEHGAVISSNSSDPGLLIRSKK